LAIDSQPGVWEGQAYAGDVVDAAAIEGALPEYLEYANIREMHQNSAVGTALSAAVVDGKLHLAIKVVDDDAWTKVKEKVYKGFSIGGRVIEAVLEKLPNGTYIRRILKLMLTEISLVDRPANPDARILVFKMEDAAMADTKDKDTESITITPALTPEQLADLQKLAGTLSLEKAASDPAKIVALIQQARNEYELSGDMDAAAMLTQAISLVQQVIGGADAAETPETDVAAEPGVAAADQAVAAAAAAGDLAKAGRMLNTKNLAAMENTVKTLLQMMATAGSTKAQKAIAAMADGDEMAMSAKAIGSELEKVLQPFAVGILNINDRLTQVERQPMPGGPVLRPGAVAKVIAGQDPPANTKPVMPGIIKLQLDDLARKARVDPNPTFQRLYQAQIEDIRKQYQ
jgi:hypothetical protein